MKGNESLGITAEAVALMEAERGNAYSKYLVTNRARFAVGLARLIVPVAVKRVFSKRLELSDDLHEMIRRYKPEQIVDIGSGGSVFLLDYAVKHPTVNCIELDLPKIVGWKNRMLKEIRMGEKLDKVHNLKVIPCDVLQDNIYDTLHPFLKRSKRTLAFSTGVNSYFDMPQYKAFISNLNTFMEKSGAIYLSHEALSDQRKELMSGFGGKVLRGLVRTLARGKSHTHFESEAELKRYFEERRLKLEVVKRRPENLIYMLNRI